MAAGAVKAKERCLTSGKCSLGITHILAKTGGLLNFPQSNLGSSYQAVFSHSSSHKGHPWGSAVKITRQLFNCKHTTIYDNVSFNNAAKTMKKLLVYQIRLS